VVALSTSSLFATPPSTDFKKFMSVLSGRYGDKASQRGRAWQEELKTLEQMSVAEQLTGINRFFNQRIAWQSDADIYGKDDFWATPSETMGRGRGDCEDFTIAKYVSLRQLGVPSDQLRLTYVKLKEVGGGSQAHMVLAWYETPAATPLILDNANPNILPASQRRDLSPIFSFTSDALWVAGSNQSTNATPSSRLSQWRQMLTRAQAEGIML
jgi:predicted transglutaminase-like cysteine proteinase